jgi:hypothetical protein
MAKPERKEPAAYARVNVQAVLCRPRDPSEISLVNNPEDT